MSDLSVKIYEAINQNDKPRQINNWHASSIAKCPRTLYFERKGVKGLPDNEAGGGKKLRWRAGHMLEAALRPDLETIYPNLLTNVRFTNEKLDLTGEFDAYDPDSKTLISVKSVHDYAMITRQGQVGLKQRVEDKYELKREPYVHHQWQEHAYVLLMNEPPRYPSVVTHPVENITYIYITLGGLMVTYTTPVKQDILTRVTDKVKYLNKSWKNNEVPICLCQEGKEMFKETNQYCPYKTEGGCCDSKLLVKEVASA